MEIVLLWCFVLAWMAKRGAEDLVHAVKGTPNPRYELKKQRAAAAGQLVKGQPRYGTREWAADLYSDALAAHTEKRRAAAKGLPVDDMVDVVREPKRAQQRRNAEWEAEQRREAEWKKGMQPIGDYEKPTCVRCRATYAQPGSAYCPACDRAEGNYPDTRPTARIYLFPNPKHVEKEISMSNEVTGLSTAIAFAEQAATAHTSFATTGAEGYVGALEQGGNAGEVVASAREAMEASGIAAEKWAAHRGKLQDQLNLKEAYRSQPDAADKEFLLAE